VQVIDVAAMQVVKSLRPGRTVLHLEFTPRGEQAWISSRDDDAVQVIDVAAMQVVKSLRPGRTVLHLEFTPRGEQAWVSSRDDDSVIVYDTSSYAELARLAADKPSGIFLTSRAAMTGF